MQVEVRGPKNWLDQEFRVYADRRLRFALGRFGERIAKVTIRFQDPNGTRGGIDKQCLLALALRPSGEIRIEDLDADLRVVVDRLAGRVARAVDRNLHRHASARRAKPPTRSVGIE